MSQKTIVACFVVLASFLFAHGAAFAAPEDVLLQGQDLSQDQEYPQVLNRIAALRKSRDLDGLERIGEEIQKKWSSKPKRYYLALMGAAAITIASTDFGYLNSDRQDYLAQKYALLALGTGNDIPVDEAVALLPDLWPQEAKEYAKGTLQGEAWLKARNEHAQLWLKTWRLLEQNIDRNYNFKEQLFINFGLDLSAVKDPKKSAERQQAIQENDRKSKERSVQMVLRSIEDSYLPVAEKYLVDVYSKAPYNTEELGRSLDLYVTDKERKAKVLKGVEEAIKRNAQEEQDKVPQTALENAENH